MEKLRATLFCLTLVLAISSISPVAGQEPEVAPKDLSTQRVRTILATIETARSVDEVRRVLGRKNLSRAEIEELRLEPRHFERLESLAEAELRGKRPSGMSSTDVTRVREQRQGELDSQAHRLVTSANQSLATEMQRLRALSPSGSRTAARMVEQPAITRATPGRITYSPGGTSQRFIVEGRNFLPEGGSAEFRFATRRFPAEVLEWSDSWVELQVPEITGFMRETGAIVIRTRNGLEARTAVAYMPATVTRVLDSRDCNFLHGSGSGCGKGGERGTGSFDVTCGPYYGDGFGDLPRDDPLWLLCLSGQRQEFQTRIDLRNGWRVFEAGHEQTGCYGWHDCRGWRGSGTRCGAYHENPPARGSQSIVHTNVIWTDAWAQCEFVEQIVIEGPAGVPHSRPYDPSEGPCEVRQEGC